MRASFESSSPSRSSGLEAGDAMWSESMCRDHIRLRGRWEQQLHCRPGEVSAVVAAAEKMRWS